jgi:hypothetical protein
LLVKALGSVEAAPVVVDDLEAVAAVVEQPTVTSESSAEVPEVDSVVVVDMVVLQPQPTAVDLVAPLLLLLMEALQHTVVPVAMAEVATVIHQPAAANRGGKLLHVDASLFRFPFIFDSRFNT